MLSEEGYLYNKDGKCIGGGRAGGVAYITECGGVDSGPPVLRWNMSGNRIMSENGACLSAGGAKGDKVLLSDEACSSFWGLL